MSARLPSRAIAFFLIIAWSLACMHLTLVSHGVSRSGKLFENTECVKSVLLPMAPASAWSVGDVNDQPVDHSCALAELINASILISGSTIRALVSVEHHVTDHHFRSAIVERAVLERAPKSSPPQA